MEKKHFCISLAGHSIGIDALYTRVFSMCEEYVCHFPPELHIKIDKNDIEAERVEAGRRYAPRREDYLETIAVYRKICEEMLTFDTFLMHGAVVAVGDYAYMFTADSGVGKTTHIEKWLENAEGAFVVNGDKPLIKITDTQAIACGTPWCGKEHLGTSTMVPIKAIVMMERGEANNIEQVSYDQAFVFLLQQTYWPKDSCKMKKTLVLFSRLKGKVLFYKFCFNNLKEDAFDVAFNALVNEAT